MIGCDILKNTSYMNAQEFWDKKELKEKALKCKLMPLVDKPFFDLLAEVF